MTICENELESVKQVHDSKREKKKQYKKEKCSEK